jgi:membrane-bound metal-dependent hydrolase YbcI (DUF457 family)
MSSAKHHALLGATVGAAADILFQLWRSQQVPGRPFDWLQLAACAAVGGGIGILADVLEPAINPNHRAFFHSVTFGVGAFYATHGPHTCKWTQDQRAAGCLCCYCYLSHLVADARTPRGLPWI